MPLITSRASRRIGALALLVAPALFGCRTRMLVEDVSCLPAGQFVDGLPFRVRETHTITVFQWKPDANGKDGKFEPVFTRRMAFPNLDKVFALNYRAEAFADSKLQLTYEPDNSITSVVVTGTPNAEGAKGLATLTTDVAKSLATVEDEIRKRTEALRTAEQTERQGTLTDYQDLRAYEDAYNAVKAACQAYGKADDDKDETKKAEAAAFARARMHDCNEKAIKLGVALPFPNAAGLDVGNICKGLR